MSKVIFIVMLLSVELFAHFGKIVHLSGSAKIYHDLGDVSPAQLGSLIETGDRIVTEEGTTVRVLLTDEGTITLGPNLRYRFGKSSVKSTKHDAGMMDSVSMKLSTAAPERFTLKNTSAVMGLRKPNITKTTDQNQSR